MSEDGEKYIGDYEIRPVSVLKSADKISRNLQEMREANIIPIELSYKVDGIIASIHRSFIDVVRNLSALSDGDSNLVIEKSLYKLLMSLPSKLNKVAFQSGEGPLQKQLLDIKDRVIEWYGRLSQMKSNVQGGYDVRQFLDIINTLLSVDLDIDAVDAIEKILHGDKNSDKENLFGIELNIEEFQMVFKLIMQTRIRRAEIELNDLLIAERLNSVILESKITEISNLMYSVDEDVLKMYQNDYIDDDYYENIRKSIYDIIRELIFCICRFDADDDSDAENIANSWCDVVEEGKADPDLHSYIAVVNFENFRSIMHGTAQRLRDPNFNIANKADLGPINIQGLLSDFLKTNRLLSDEDVAKVIEEEVVSTILDFVGDVMSLLEKAVLEDEFEMSSSSAGHAAGLLFYQNHMTELLNILLNEGIDIEKVKLYRAWVNVSMGQSLNNMNRFCDAEELISKTLYEFKKHIQTLPQISDQAFAKTLDLHYLMGIAEVENIRVGLFEGEIVDEEIYFENFNSLNKRIKEMEGIERRLILTDMDHKNVIEDDGDGDKIVVNRSNTLRRLLDKVLKKDNNTGE